MKKIVISMTLMFAVTALSNGGNIGSSGKSNDFILARCNSAVGVLINAKERGDRLWRRSSNNPERVVDYFEAELNRANDMMSEFKSEFSLVKRSIERGLLILNALKSEGDLIEPKDQIRFLRSLYSLIVDGVIYIDGVEVKKKPVITLDQDHRRYRNEARRNSDGKWSCKSESRKDKEFHESNCRENEIRAWEQRFTEYIDLEIEWFINTHSGTGYFSEPGGEKSVRIVPFGSTKAFTIPGELMTGYIVEDFKDVLWTDVFECSKEMLEGLGADLYNYNNNSPDAEKGPDIVAFSHATLRKVQQQARSCVGLPGTPGVPR